MTRIPQLAAAALVAGLPSLATADEPAGCAAFKWPVDRERAALAATSQPAIANGGELAYEVAATLKLAPLGEAGLQHAPERASKSAQSFAGHFKLPIPSRPGVYKVTIASAGWIDVLDNGAFLHPKGYSGAVGCEGARKSIKFELPARPVEIQVSGVRDDTLSLIVSPE